MSSSGSFIRKIIFIPPLSFHLKKGAAWCVPLGRSVLLLIFFISPQIMAFSVVVTPSQGTKAQEKLPSQKNFLGQNLKRSAHVIVKNYGALGNPEQVSFYGMPSSSTSVQLDDLLLDTQGLGGFNFGILTGAQISQTHLYTLTPHPSYQGVGHIELLSLNLNRPYAHDLTIEGSTLGQASGSISSIVSLSKSKIGLFASGILDEGLPQYGPRRTWGERNTFSNGMMGLKNQVALNADWSLTLLLLHKKSALSTDLGLDLPPHPEGKALKHFELGQLSLTYDAGSAFRHHFWVGGFRDRDDYQAPSTKNRFEDETFQVGYDLRHHHQKHVTHFRANHIAMRSFQSQPHKRGHQGHSRLFLSHTFYPLDQLAWEVATLGEKHTAHNPTVSPQTRLQFFATETWTFTTGYKMARRFPTLAENPRVFRTQSKLKPERTELVELGAHWKQEAHQVYGKFFLARIKDAIETIPTSPSTYYKVNRQLKTGGFIIGTEHSLEDHHIHLSYTQTHLHKRNEESLRTTVPKHKVFAEILSKLSPKTELSNRFLIYSSRLGHRFSPTFKANLVKLQGYVLWRCRFSYRPAAGVNLYVEGRNLFDQRYFDIPDFRPPGRAIHVGIHAKF